MQRLTKGSPIIEQQLGGYSHTLAIPKAYMLLSGLRLKDTVYLTAENQNPLTIRYSLVKTEGAKKRKVMGFAGYYKLSVPSRIGAPHAKGSRWECYEDGGDLYYKLHYSLTDDK